MRRFAGILATDPTKPLTPPAANRMCPPIRERARRAGSPRWSWCRGSASTGPAPTASPSPRTRDGSPPDLACRTASSLPRRGAAQDGPCLGWQGGLACPGSAGSWSATCAFQGGGAACCRFDSWRWRAAVVMVCVWDCGRSSALMSPLLWGRSCVIYIENVSSGPSRAQSGRLLLAGLALGAGASPVHARVPCLSPWGLVGRSAAH